MTPASVMPYFSGPWMSTATALQQKHAGAFQPNHSAKEHMRRDKRCAEQRWRRTVDSVTRGLTSEARPTQRPAHSERT